MITPGEEAKKIGRASGVKTATFGLYDQKETMDIKHTPEITDQGGACVDCGTPIPIDVVAFGEEVIELGGAGVHWLPAFAHEGISKECVRAKRRSNTVLVCVLCEGEGCEECYDGLVASDGASLDVRQAKPKRSEVIERAPTKTESEKAVHRMAFHNFVAMREATKPDAERVAEDQTDDLDS